MRFRKYLGEQYSRDSLPIITIYFIGYAFDRSLPKVIEVARVFRDRLTGNDAEHQKNEFIDSLTHDSFVIQLFELKTEMRNRLEKVLSVFSHSSGKDRFRTYPSKDHIVYYDYPLDDELQQKIVQRLNYAVSDETLKRQMDLEEEILMELQDLERKIEDQAQTIQESRKTIEEKEKTIEEQNRMIEELKKKLGIG